MKRTVSMLVGLSLIAVPLLAACGKTDEGAKTPAGAGNQGTAAGKTVPEKYDPPIELTTVNYSFPTTKFFNGEDINNNIWTRTLLEKYGIKVKTQWYVPNTEYDKKTNLMIASGEIPDFFAATPQQFRQLYEAGQLEDLTKVYNDHAPESIKKVMQEAGETVLKSATFDGKLMAIPWSGVAKEGPSILWIRKDWKEKLQLPDPKTIDDLVAIADAFTKKDPDGNGKDDTFGLAMDKELSMAVGLLNGFGAYADFWTKDASGNLAYSEIQPEMKQALTKLSEMYKAGHFDPEFIVKDGNKVNESIGGNKIGMMIGGRGSANSPLVSLTPNQEWQAYPMPTVDGKPFKAQLPLNIFSYYWVVKKGTKNPEAIFKMMDFWLQTYYYNKSEDVYYKYIVPSKEDGSALWTYSPVKIYLPDNNIENYRQATAVLDGKIKPEELAPERKKVYDRIMLYKGGQKNLWGEYAQNGPGGSAGIIDQIIKDDRFVPNQFYTTPTATMAERNEQLKKLRNETFVKIVTGNLGLDAFDKYVADWKKQGGDIITKEVNDWYATQKK
ncbi:extracellular solute-binding protein [Paenibacillus hemerocallicola]|uniref:Extracellular solute-binding protein n=1 Tax=Paenibacillus hemerocallicola TaxID=1172614 RepID=A0A5C4TDA2_9BACL|nr:extracellular solute-binding protein [Paenibacillus hemerocallicola]TNJ67038.1 extracellular solute-binding protein [Paenibacillus hemerocallicola]